MADYRRAFYATIDAEFRAARLTESQAARRKRRQRSGGKYRDTHLELATARLAALKAELNRLREILAEGIYKIARNYAKRYRPESTGLDREDCIQLGVIYAFSCVHKYDPERRTATGQKTSLLSWLTRCLTNAWLPLLRKRRTGNEAFSKYADHQRYELEYLERHGHELQDLEGDDNDYVTESLSA